MEIVTLDAHDDTQGEELFRLYQAVHATDCPDNPPPLRDAFLMLLRQDHSEARVLIQAARRDGQLLGAGLLVMPTADNRQLAQAEAWVDPAHRRQGVGRALFESLVRLARQQQRSVLFAQANGPVPGGPPRPEAGARFLAAMGFSAALPVRMRRFDLSAADRSAEQALLDECLPHAPDYEIATWTGPAPEAVAPGVAYLANRVVQDMPRGDLELEVPTLDTERLRTGEKERMVRGTHLVGAAAVHRQTSVVAAVTRVDVRPPGDHGDIWLTIAHPAHRGHRLGTIVKIYAHRLVRERFPQLRYVLTGNADANSHMLAVNERLGYVAYQDATSYQRRL